MSKPLEIIFEGRVISVDPAEMVRHKEYYNGLEGIVMNPFISEEQKKSELKQFKQTFHKNGNK
jgi:hypothetical protein